MRLVSDDTLHCSFPRDYRATLPVRKHVLRGCVFGTERHGAGAWACFTWQERADGPDKQILSSWPTEQEAEKVARNHTEAMYGRPSYSHDGRTDR